MCKSYNLVQKICFSQQKKVVKIIYSIEICIFPGTHLLKLQTNFKTLFKDQQKFQNKIFLSIYLFHPQQYFAYTQATSIMAKGSQVVLVENSQIQAS